MRDYQIGDTFVFSTTENIEWILVEIREKTYKFVNLWNPGQAWTSQKKAPVHRWGPVKHYRGGILLQKNNFD